MEDTCTSKCIQKHWLLPVSNALICVNMQILVPERRIE